MANATISVNPDPIQRSRTATFTVTWNESVDGFGSDDIRFAIPTITVENFTRVSGSEYTFTINPGSFGQISFFIDDDSVSQGNARISFRQNTVEPPPNPVPTITFDPNPGIAGTDVTVTVTFSDSVINFASGDITISVGTKGTFTAVSGSVYRQVVRLPSGADGTLTASVAGGVAENSNGDPNTMGSGTLNYERPTATITFDEDEGVSGVAVTGKITFNTSVTGVSASEVLVTGGTRNSFSGSGSDYTFEVIPTRNVDGTLTVTLSENAATQGNAQASGTLDYARPVVTLTAAQTSVGNSHSVRITISWDVAPSRNDFATGDVSVTGGTKGAFSGSGRSFSLLITSPSAGSGTVVVTVPGNSIYEGNVAKSVRISYSPIPVPTISFDTATPISGRAMTATIDFSRDVSGFATGDVGVTGGAKGAFTRVTARQYTLVITPTIRTDGTVVVSIDADAVTEGNISATRSIAYLRPRFTISFNVSRLNLSGEAIATIRCSTSTSFFETGDVSVTGGTKGTFSVVDASTYRLAFTSPASGSGTIVISIGENVVPEGNPAVSASITYADVIRPTITFSVATAIRATAFTATITFSAPVTGVRASLFTVTGATRGGLSVTSSTVYVLTITPPSTGSGVIRVSIGEDAVSEGNIAATATISYAGSTLPPEIVKPDELNLMINTDFRVPIEIRNVPDIATAEGLQEKVYYRRTATGIEIVGNLPDLKTGETWDLFAENVHGTDTEIAVYNVVEPPPIISSVPRQRLRKGQAFSLNIPVTNRIGSSVVRGLLVYMQWEQLESSIRIYGRVPNVEFTVTEGEFRVVIENSAGSDTATIPFDIAA